MFRDRLKFIFLLVLVAGFALVVWYSPVLFKGYSVLISRDSLLSARNYAQFGVVGIEDNLNICLASSLSAEKSNPPVTGNKITAIGYGLLFKIFGLPKYDNLVFFSIAILIIVLLIFTIVVYYLFNLKVALFFALIYILLPFNWYALTYNFGIYEFPLLFFSLFFLFFALGIKSEYKCRYWLLVLSGFFLAFAGIAKEVFLMFAPVLFFYLLWQRQKKYLLLIFIPFFIIVSLFWLPDMVLGQNAYRLLFWGKEKDNAEKFLDYGYYSHTFPDPYTYHFDRDNFIEKYQIESSLEIDFFQRIALVRSAYIGGVEKIGFFPRLKMGTVLLARHISRFLSIEDIGGPMIFILLVMGFIYLKEKDRYLYRFFVFWVFAIVMMMSFVTLGNRNHLMDFSWAVALVVALGLIFLTDIFSQHFQLEKTGRFILLAFLSLLIFYNLILSSHVLWGRIYDEEKFLVASVYARAVNQLNISDRDVIAVNIPGTEWAKLNYLTDKSMVVFAPETIEELIQEDKLQDAFDKFGVKYILGYSPELTQKILADAKAENIASDDIDLTPPEVSQTKSWLMNLVR